MDFKLQKLESGLRLLTVPMKSVQSVTLTVWVKTGSRFEDIKISGISHFLEHMVFKGSKKRPSARQISQIVDAIGGEFNAATSKDWTNFYIKTSIDNAETAMDVLSDMVLNPLLKEDEIEREKGTIIQEIAMYKDTPMMHIGEVFEELLLNGNPLSREISGTPQSVSGIKRKDFLGYRDTHYFPENMMVSVVGGIKETAAKELVNRYFSTLKAGNKRPISTKYFVSTQNAPQVKIATKKAEQAHLVLGFQSDGRGYKGRFAQSVLATILGGGMSSRLFIEVRERRGLAYSIHTSIDRYQEVGHLSTYAGVDVNKADEAVKIIWEEHKKLAGGQTPIDSNELKKAKEYLKGHLALALEDTKDVTGYFADPALFETEILSPKEAFKRLDAVTLDEVMDEAKKLIASDRLNLAIIGPFKDEQKFIKLLK